MSTTVGMNVMNIGTIVCTCSVRFGVTINAMLVGIRVIWFNGVLR